MAVRNARYVLLSLVLLVIVFFGIYFFTQILRGFHPGYMLALAILAYTGTALNRARNIVAPPRFPILRVDPQELGLPPFEEVHFNSRDGVDLSGWLIGSKNRAAVILVHTQGGSRVQMRHFARPLAEAGYGVLLFDLRAHARSGGSLSANAWIEHQDLLGAYDFLSRKDNIDPGRIGALGVALGAQIALRAAAAGGTFAALWTDGPVPVVYDDHFDSGRRGLRTHFFAPWWWLVYNTLEWLTGISQPRPLIELVGEIGSCPLMVVASGPDRLVALARFYHSAAGDPAGFWQIDDIPFASGILERGDDYDLKLVGFFERGM